MGQIDFTTGLVLLALFAVSIVTFAANFGNDNGTTINIDDDSDFNTMKTGVGTDINVFYTDMNTSSDAMYKSTISSQTEATEGGTAFKVGPTTSLGFTKKILTTSWTKVFGSDSGFGIFLTALIAMLGFISVMYIYKAWAGRNPD